MNPRLQRFQRDRVALGVAIAAGALPECDLVVSQNHLVLCRSYIFVSFQALNGSSHREVPPLVPAIPALARHGAAPAVPFGDSLQDLGMGVGTYRRQRGTLHARPSMLTSISGLKFK